jgi:hypothetical protein
MATCQKCGKELENENDVLCSECAKDSTKVQENKENLFQERAVALVIDTVILFGILILLSYIWSVIPLLCRWNSLREFILAVVGVIYFLIRDNLFDGQSIGKKIMGLKIYKKGTKQVIDTNNSIMGNIDLTIFAIIGAVLKLIPVIFFGFFSTLVSLFNLILGIGSLGIFIFEAYLLYSGGSRLGDKLGSTVVVKEE